MYKLDVSYNVFCLFVFIYFLQSIRININVIYDDLYLQNIQYVETPSLLLTYDPLMMEPNEVSKPQLPWYFKGKH